MKDDDDDDDDASAEKNADNDDESLAALPDDETYVFPQHSVKGVRSCIVATYKRLRRPNDVDGAPASWRFDLQLCRRVCGGPRNIPTRMRRPIERRALIDQYESSHRASFSSRRAASWLGCRRRGRRKKNNRRAKRERTSSSAHAATFTI